MSIQLEIINVALLNLSAKPIQSLSSASVEAVSASVYWDQTRKALLALHTWNFALKEVELAQTVGQVSHEYAYTYTLPTDLIRIVKILGDMDYRLIGNQLHTNQSVCKLKYVFDQTETTAWSPSFADLMSTCLAAKMAYPITRNQSVAQAQQALYEQKLKEARFIDSTQDIQEPFAQGHNSLIASRF